MLSPIISTPNIKVIATTIQAIIEIDSFLFFFKYFNANLNSNITLLIHSLVLKNYFILSIK
ncbi:hypothetical protein GCM10008904_29720 [Paraclostridium ghonii]